MRPRTILLFAAPIVAVVVLSWLASVTLVHTETLEAAADDGALMISVSAVGEVVDPGDPDRCDGLPTSDRRPVTDPAEVAALTLCVQGSAHRPGDGWWSTRETRSVAPDRVAAVARTLVPVANPGAGCIALAYAVPVVVVTATDGSRFVAAVPHGACDGGEQAAAVLGDAASGVVPGVEYVFRTATEQQVMTGCGQAKPVSPEAIATPVLPPVPESGLSTCVHGADPLTETALRAMGPADPVIVSELLATLSAAPPPGCVEAEQLGDFLTIVTVPPAGGPTPIGEPLVSVQTTGCRVVVDAGWATLGFADPGPVDQLLSATS